MCFREGAPAERHQPKSRDRLWRPALDDVTGESENAMPGFAQRATRSSQDKREIKYIVRAPDPNNRGRWNTVGVAFDRKNGQEGLTIKLNTLPVGNWDGSLILLPPLTPDDEPQEE
jgi:hypothetical protein